MELVRWSEDRVALTRSALEAARSVLRADYCAVVWRPPDGAPLEYHESLLSAYREALDRHGLEPPPGYGPPGPGNAVFYVSSFMDTLEPALAA